jgi:hypothetical protein
MGVPRLDSRTNADPLRTALQPTGRLWSHDHGAVIGTLAGASSTLAVSLRRRLPSAREAFATYLACLLPIVGWSVFSLLDEGLPVWSHQMRAWDILGVVAYVQAFALAESIIVFIPLVLVSLVLPPGWFRDKFVALATGIAYLSAAWFVVAQLNDETLRTWGFRQVLRWGAAYCASLVLISALIHRSSRLEAMISSFVSRATVLGSAYLLLALAAVGIVVIRNL